MKLRLIRTTIKLQQTIRDKFSIILFLATFFLASSIGHAAPGDVDLSFDAGAIIHSSGGGSVYSTVVQPDGKILVGGYFTSINGTDRKLVARLNADGSLDLSFNSTLESSASSGIIYAMALQPDGKLIVAGSFVINNEVKLIARLNQDGSLDGSFSIPFQVGSPAYATALQPDGKIIVGGQLATFGGTPGNGIVRLGENGGLDTPLGFNGNLQNSVYGVAVQADGKILVGGNFFVSNSNPVQSYIARLNADGTLDTTFNVGSGANNSVFAFAVQPDGKILVGGYFTNISDTPHTAIARLNPDGTADASFAPSLLDNRVLAILLQPDGKILIGGGIGAINGVSRSGIARLNADGSLDSFYPSNGPGHGANNLVRTIAAKPDGKILIGGDFSTVAGIARSHLAQLLDSADNAPPVLSNVAVTSPINENGTATLSGNISDADAADTFTLTVNWGDGSAPQVFNYAAGTTAFSETHQYLDDNPSATPSDNYSINLTLSDTGGGNDTDSAQVTVNNLAPVLSSITLLPSTITVGDSTTLSGNISDIGTLDTQTVVINWGDGSVNTTLNLAAGVSSFNANHQYNSSGVFNIAITASDDDTGATNANASVTVNPPPPPPPPTAPSDLTATAVSTTQINLTWVDNAGNEDGYKIERCNKGKTCTNFVEIAQVGANVTSFSNTGLANNTQYRYRVRAFNADGNSAYSNIAAAKTPRR